MPTSILAILITITIYSSITYIESLLFDIKNNNNDHQLLRFISSILISVLVGVIYFNIL